MLLIRDSIGVPGLNPGYIDFLKRQAAGTTANKELLNKVFESFRSVDSFHIPRPSLAVCRANVRIRAGDCEEPFLNALCDGANYTIRKILPKRINGDTLNGENFKLYIMTLVENFKRNQIDVANLIQAIDHYRLSKLMTAERNAFLAHFSEVFEEQSLPMDPEAFALTMKPLIEKSILSFIAKVPGADEEKEPKTNAYREMLNETGNEKAAFNATCFMKMQSMKPEDQAKLKKVTRAVLLGIGVGGLVVATVGGVAAVVIYGSGATTVSSVVVTVQRLMASEVVCF
ncbi:unnamed protein product, partial [Mesorhabditis belari]|uniref:Uncharacterized protein n=1 Tax=Mesorhabditis belari TaxID=2138241 RepID=A0AAF3EHQ4_9BILA